MDMFEAAEKLVVIKIAGGTWLGFVEGNQIVWAIDYGEYAISHWIQSANTGELTSIQIVNQGYTQRPLSRLEKMELDRCLALMKRVKQYSMRYYENSLFIDFYKPHKN